MNYRVCLLKPWHGHSVPISAGAQITHLLREILMSPGLWRKKEHGNINAMSSQPNLGHPRSPRVWSNLSWSSVLIPLPSSDLQRNLKWWGGEGILGISIKNNMNGWMNEWVNTPTLSRPALYIMVPNVYNLKSTTDFQSEILESHPKNHFE